MRSAFLEFLELASARADSSTSVICIKTSGETEMHTDPEVKLSFIITEHSPAVLKRHRVIT